MPLLVMHDDADKLAGVAGSRMAVDQAIVLKDLTGWIGARAQK